MGSCQRAAATLPEDLVMIRDHGVARHRRHPRHFVFPHIVVDFSQCTRARAQVRLGRRVLCSLPPRRTLQIIGLGAKFTCTEVVANARRLQGSAEVSGDFAGHNRPQWGGDHGPPHRRARRTAPPTRPQARRCRRDSDYRLPQSSASTTDSSSGLAQIRSYGADIQRISRPRCRGQFSAREGKASAARGDRRLHRRHCRRASESCRATSR